MNENAFILERYANLISRIQQLHYEATTNSHYDSSPVKIPTTSPLSIIAATSSDDLPSLHDIFKIKDLTSNKVNLQNESHLVYTFGLISAKLYAHTLSKLLQSVLFLNTSISYWESIRHSGWHQTYYLMQTFPIRIQEFILEQYQLTNNTGPTVSTLSEKKSFIQSFSSIGLHLYQKMRNDDLGAQLPRQIHRHLKVLRRDQEVLAGWLGGLSDLSNNVVITTLNHVYEISNLIRSGISAIRDVDRRDDLYDGSIPMFDASWLSRISDDSTEGDIPIALEQVEQSLTDIFHSLKQINPKLPNLMRDHGPPSRVLQRWPLVIVGLLALKILSRNRITSSYNIIKTSINESYNTLKAFSIDWILKPLEDIYKTIRHGEPQLAALGSLSLESDMESLGRMVIDFAKDHKIVGIKSPGGHVVGTVVGTVPEGAFEVLVDRAKLGDISVVLERYEDAIRNPIRGAIGGDLIRSLLIQVQQAKVQLELAMSALDKLLKSNELNFAFLAVIPSILISYGVGRLVYNFSSGRQLRGWNQTRMLLIRNLRNIERILNTSSSSDNALSSSQHKLNPTQQGFLLAHMTELRKLAKMLPRKKNIRTYFIEDVRDIENGGLSVGQRLRTIDRMWRMYIDLK